jgi:aspartyl-tRNA(Asn)/glutamyl-tRNA(Gln) amidotransferase subunit A
MSDPLFFGLVELAETIRRREISSVEVTTGVLARIKSWQPVINAFIELDEEGALQAARTADEELATRGPRGPLHGVPLAHKDIFDRSGSVVTGGSVLRRAYRATSDATVIRRMNAAGSVTLGSLNTAEFAYSPTGANSLSGPARNPWNPAHICGGSSSGSAAAVSARLCFGALGSDTGGSIRLPAAICGTVGLMPTHGRVSLHGAMPLSFSLDCVGPLTRTVRDAARMLSVIAGHDGADATSLPEPVQNYEAACSRGAAGLRIGMPHGYFWRGTVPAATATLEDAIRRTESDGARVVQVFLPEIEPVVAAANIVIGAESAALHRRTLAAYPAEYSSPVRQRIENGLGYTAYEYLDALKYRATALARFLDAIGEVDVLAVPCLGIPTPTIAATEDSSSVSVSSLVAQLSYWTRPVNFLGVPAISVPCGFFPDGLPLGIQLIGKPFQEALLLQAAAAFEAVSGMRGCWPAEPSPIRDRAVH